LILSELVTNSVRHAAVLSPNVTVIYAVGPDTFAFAVHDRHPCQPALYATPGNGGSGLATVVELVRVRAYHRGGTRGRPGQKRVDHPDPVRTRATMTIEWRYTTHQQHGVLSLAGFLGAEAVDRFTGAVGWVLARGTGPVILDLTELRGWSVGGQLAVAQAARRLAAEGRRLELAAIPADGSLVPDGAHPPIPVRCDLATAVAAYQDVSDPAREWCSDDWPGARNPAAQGQM
jgi:hypothetical protein